MKRTALGNASQFGESPNYWIDRPNLYFASLYNLDRLIRGQVPQSATMEIGKTPTISVDRFKMELHIFITDSLISLWKLRN